jgi:hypothetical protein
MMRTEGDDMTYRGTVKGGVIVVDGPTKPPEGAVVSVNVIESMPVEQESGPTWAEVFKDVIGKAKGLPADSSSNHDHYLYGVPKRE